MQLISLTSNQTSFKPVVFKNAAGLNFIVAKQNQADKVDKKKTFNGVGKSLLIAIIHFCLGSNKNESFKKHLPGWEFTLRFKIGQTEYLISRVTDGQQKIRLDGEDIKLSELTSRLGDLLFEIPADIDYLSFRSLLPFFIRPRRGSYVSFKDPNELRKDYQILMTNSFLLGLNVYLVKEKYRLRVERERIKALIKELSNDQLLKDFFSGSKDVSLATDDLTEKINRLESDLSQFDVAEDFYEIKNEADRLRRELEKTQNEIVLFQNQVQNIDESLKKTPDLKRESIERIYREASVSLSDSVTKKLEDLEAFYKHLSTSRQKRLVDQKEELNREINALVNKFQREKVQFDATLKYLDTHQALDVFVKLTNRLSDLKSEKDKLQRYDELLKQYQDQKIKLDRDFVDETGKTAAYLDVPEGVIKELRDFFRELAKHFYPDSAAGITIKNNDGDNQVRYDFDAKIQADASDGINSVKIFCYDITLLLRGAGHNVDMIFHDSRLIDGIDPRQVAVLFQVLQEYIVPSGRQYILTVNQNHLDDVRPYLTPEEYQSIILDNVCHNLEDDSPESKLLGIQVDMKYD
ncbi:MAG: hypothetical protein BGO31_13070 [Bacteroidetes bacterium 43-16]|nr:MAG: hypothetical protein BGO31_13070 [Bacteroidetes bacterium 43-16]